MTLDDIFQCMATQGQTQYGGEAVSQLEHALQAAQLAQQAQQPCEMVAASLLHDLGHLLDDLSEQERNHPAHDHRHEIRVMPVLARLFSPAVTEPIRLHVDAKRYLCAIESGYVQNLTPASAHSLALQGGAFTLKEAKVFMVQPFARQALDLRRYDDWAKVPNKPTPGLEHYRAMLMALERQHRGQDRHQARA